MKKKDIIKSSDEYTEIINTGKTRKNKYYSIYYRNNDKSNRYGITIPKKLGIAVLRNKTKRTYEANNDTQKVNLLDSMECHNYWKYSVDSALHNATF